MGALKVNTLGMVCFLMMNSDPGKTSALAKPQSMALQADARRVGAGPEKNNRTEAHGNCKRNRLAREFLWKLLEITGNTLKGVNFLERSVMEIHAIKIEL